MNIKNKKRKISNCCYNGYNTLEYMDSLCTNYATKPFKNLTKGMRFEKFGQPKRATQNYHIRNLKLIFTSLLCHSHNNTRLLSESAKEHVPLEKGINFSFCSKNRRLS